MRKAEGKMFDVLIIGAGFAGLYQLHCLRDRLGLSALVLEAGGGVGGTWYWNRYPGARCDSESHAYCYTFSKELLEEWQWSERYPGQPEIMRYLNHVADRFDLKRDIRFNARVTAARYDEPANLWHVATDDGPRAQRQVPHRCRRLPVDGQCAQLPGLGRLSRADWVHTGQWPHDGVDFRGQRVGLIGTGSTGIQAVPVIAETATHLTVFQRTANYSVPARNAPLTLEFQRYVKENHAEIRRMMHSTPNGQPFPVEDRSAFDVTPEQRQKLYEAAWEKGGLQFRATFRDLLADKAANDTASEFHQEQNPPDCKGPGDGRETGRHRPSIRSQAAADRHRLLRDVQPRERVAGRCSSHADRGDHTLGAAERGTAATISWTSSCSRPVSMP